MSSQEAHINAVAFKEGDVWIIQGIEYDIVAHASDVTKLSHAFMRAVAENAVITEHLGRKPLEGIKPAPQRFRDMFDQAETEVRPTKPPAAPYGDVTVRVTEVAA